MAKTRIIAVRVGPQFAQRVMRECQRLGVTMSVWLRSLAYRELKIPEPKNEE